jgi:hypothetical protein
MSADEIAVLAGAPPVPGEAAPLEIIFAPGRDGT